MTVHERNCCILLYKYLRRDLDGADLDYKTIICGMNSYLLYKQIMNKRKNNLSLNSDEDLFVNYFYYDNEMLLMNLDLEFKKLINRTTTEIENFMKLFDTYNDSIDFKNNVYLYLPFKYTNIELENIIFSRLFNYDSKEMDYYSLIKLFLKSEESKKNYGLFLNFCNKEGLDINKIKAKIKLLLD